MRQFRDCGLADGFESLEGAVCLHINKENRVYSCKNECKRQQAWPLPQQLYILWTSKHARLEENLNQL